MPIFLTPVVRVNLSSSNFRRADFSDASLDTCLPPGVASPECGPANFTNADMHQVDLSGASTSTCFSVDYGGVIGRVNYAYDHRLSR